MSIVKISENLTFYKKISVKYLKIPPKIVENIPTHVLQHLRTIFGGILYILQKFSHKKPNFH